MGPQNYHAPEFRCNGRMRNRRTRHAFVRATRVRTVHAGFGARHVAPHPWAPVTKGTSKGTDLDLSQRMRLWTMMGALVGWPIDYWHSLQARRRLRQAALRPGSGRLTLERVA